MRGEQLFFGLMCLFVAGCLAVAAAIHRQMVGVTALTASIFVAIAIVFFIGWKRSSDDTPRISDDEDVAQGD